MVNITQPSWNVSIAAPPVRLIGRRWRDYALSYNLAFIAAILLPACLFGQLLAVAAPPPSTTADTKLTATLKAAKPVQAKLLSVKIEPMIPRPDSVVPAGLIELLKDETIVRVYPWCKFQMVEGRCSWNWHFGLSSGILGMTEATKIRLSERLTKLGFEAYDAQHERFSLAFRRDVAGCRESVSLAIPGEWVGGDAPTVGIELEWTIQAAAGEQAPTLKEVFFAMPTMRPPKRGAEPIPELAVNTLLAEKVQSVSLDGPGNTWYSLGVEIPKPDDKNRPPWITRLVEVLKDHGFEQLDLRSKPNGGVRIVDMSCQKAGTTARCQATVLERADTFQVNLFVQTGE